jgi:ABC-type sulfate/molybdate transport systems ATPase subunit
VTSEVYLLESVQVRFGPRLALDIAELAIPAGCPLILMGPNGSGKSTLLGVLACLTKPDRGRVAFGGVPVNWTGRELTALRKQVTLLHQHSYLFSGTVMANVGIGLRLRGAKKDDIRCSVERTLAMVGLAGFETRDAAHLSGGEARRVALARALACKPQVLLMDEPLTHVDQETAQIIETLIAFQSGEGTSIVMSSHDEDITERLSSRVIRLSEGRIVNEPV